MKISIVTVCRNAAEDLERTIKSVLSQDYPDKEFIVVDGASTDSTPEVLAGYRDRIDTIVSEPDKGIYDAMNKGTRLASGEWVIFMNAADCFADSNVLTKLAEAAGHTDAGVIYGDVIKINLADPESEEILKEAEQPHSSHRMIFCHQSSMSRRDLLLKYPFDLEHPLSADFKFFKTLYHEHIPFHKVEFPIARFDTGGISNRRRSLGLADNMKVILEVDGKFRGMPHILHLLPTWALCRVQGK